MTPTLTRANARRSTPPWGCLPGRLRVLYVGGPVRGSNWLRGALAADSATNIVLDEAVTASEGIAQLRDHNYDAVLIYHEPGGIDALALIEALRAGGCEDALLVLGDASDDEMAPLCYEVGADGYACAPSIATRTLMWLIARAVERHQLLEENRRLGDAHQQRLRQEQDEAERAVRAQRDVIRDLEALSVMDLRVGQPQPEAARPRKLSLPPMLATHYRELLRAYVIMGSGNMGEEMKALAELLATAGVSARQTLELHVQVLEELLEGLGTRSSRHVMMRADLLVLEVTVHLAEGYRQRYQRRENPPRQLRLPGFETESAA